MSLKTVHHNNFWVFPNFSSVFVATEFSLLRSSFLCCDRVFSVAIEFLCFNRKLCCDRVFSVVTEFLYCNRKLCRDEVFSLAT